MAIEIVGARVVNDEQILTPAALGFISELHRRFNPVREHLLQQRAERQAALDAGTQPGFLPETAELRAADWQVVTPPVDLQKRWVEITGPVDRKMMINALNSGAHVFMADFEDSLAPTWENVVHGQRNLMDAVRGTISLSSPEGKHYRLNEKTATLLVRPRGWHLTEKHVLVDGQPISASLFDFGLFFFHNVSLLLARNTGPYFYLPKLESHLEARLWNDIFNAAEDALKLPRGTVKVTVLIETILAAFEMDEILYELRDHIVGLNAGRWDYIFSAIKKLRSRENGVLPDRSQITMTVPFMKAYTELLVRTCHRRGAHAMGGMAAYIPNRKNAAVNEQALAKVREDKLREVDAGFDGTWVAHPDLVPLAMEVFAAQLGDQPHQKDRRPEAVRLAVEELIDLRVPGGIITEAGLRNNITVCLQYLDQWLRGNGAVTIFNLMEDAATAEIARAQLWLWVQHGASTHDGRQVTPALFASLRDEELTKLGGRGVNRLAEAANLLDGLVLNKDFAEFLTTGAYALLD